jgi:hypothetical protein
MTTPTFTEGQRVHHVELGCYGRWLSYEPSYGIGGENPLGCSVVEMEDTGGRILHCPTSSLRVAGENA